jgi:hypothetical protein
VVLVLLFWLLLLLLLFVVAVVSHLQQCSKDLPLLVECCTMSSINRAAAPFPSLFLHPHSSSIITHSVVALHYIAPPAPSMAAEYSPLVAADRADAKTVLIRNRMECPVHVEV